MMRSILVLIACILAGCNSAREPTNSAPEPSTKATQSRMLLDIQSIVAKQLGKNAADVKADLTFAELGADELDLVEVAMEVENVFGISMHDDALAAAAGITNTDKLDKLCTHLTIAAFVAVAESSPKATPRGNQTEIADDGTLRESQVGTYGQLSQLPNPKGLILVFFPSFEEQRQFSEQRLGRKMDADEIELLRQKAVVMALPPEIADKLNQDKRDRKTSPQ